MLASSWLIRAETPADLPEIETLQAEAWEEGSPPYDILMAGGLDAYMRAKVRERGLVAD